jgi:hypothetical protein
MSLSCDPLGDVVTAGAIGIEFQPVNVFTVIKKIKASKRNMEAQWRRRRI